MHNIERTENIRPTRPVETDIRHFLTIIKQQENDKPFDKSKIDNINNPFDLKNPLEMTALFDYMHPEVNCLSSLLERLNFHYNIIVGEPAPKNLPEIYNTFHQAITLRIDQKQNGDLPVEVDDPLKFAFRRR